MTEAESKLWERHETARKELILFYVPLVDLIAKRIARSADWTNWEDLKQEGIIGLMKAIIKFNPDEGVPFKSFAKKHIQGAIFDSSELTRDLARRQQETYTKVRRAEEELTKTLQRNPTIDEVAENTGLTIDQIEKAIDAMGVAFAKELPDTEVWSASSGVQTAAQERTAMIYDALSHLSQREQKIIALYYWEDMEDKEIAEVLGLTPSNARKIRQRAIAKLRGLLDVKKKGGHYEE